MAVECPRYEQNMAECICTWEPCGKKGNCCLCLASHLSAGEVPGCFFPREVERTYDRSMGRFMREFEGGFKPDYFASPSEEVDCPRREENKANCPAPEGYKFRGICCLCIRDHLPGGTLPPCVEARASRG